MTGNLTPQEKFDKEVARLAALAEQGIYTYEVEFYSMSDAREKFVVEAHSHEEAKEIVKSNFERYHAVQIIGSEKVTWGVLYGWPTWVSA